MCSTRWPLAADRQLESRLVKALVQQAQAVAVEPEHLQPRRRSSAEHEHRAAVDRIPPHALTGELREPIESEPHVDRLDAEEDTHAGGNHVVASRTASSAFNADRVEGRRHPQPPAVPELDLEAARPPPRPPGRTSTIDDTIEPPHSPPRSRALGAEPVFSLYLQNCSVPALIPVSAANSFAVSPLSFQRSTRFRHSSRFARRPGHLDDQMYAAAARPRQRRAGPNGYEKTRARKGRSSFCSRSQGVRRHVGFSLMESKAGAMRGPDAEREVVRR